MRENIQDTSVISLSEPYLVTSKTPFDWALAVDANNKNSENDIIAEETTFRPIFLSAMLLSFFNTLGKRMNFLIFHVDPLYGERGIQHHS
jgi:hypothetical protein